MSVAGVGCVRQLQSPFKCCVRLLIKSFVLDIFFHRGCLFLLVLWLRLSTELYYDRGNLHNFISFVKELSEPGDIVQQQTFDFDFQKVEKPFESYTGTNVRLR